MVGKDYTLPALFSSETNPVPIYAEHSWRSRQEREEEGGRVEWPHTRRTFFDSTNEGFLPRVFSLINLIEPYFQYLHCHSAVTEIARKIPVLPINEALTMGLGRARAHLRWLARAHRISFS